MKNAKKILTVIFAVSFCLFCMFFPVDVKRGAISGLNRCISVIIPSLYAMMTASVLLMKSGGLYSAGRFVSPLTRLFFGINGESGIVFLFSVISGYPVGAKTVYSMYNDEKISKKYAELMTGLCFGAGVAFIFGCVASTAEIGGLILVSNLSAELIMAIVLSAYFRKNPTAENSRKKEVSAQILTDSVTSAGKSLGDMCLCVVIFSVFAEILEKSGIIGTVANIFNINCGILRAVLDVTAISEITADIPTASALISFGGVCVFFQISAIFRGKLSILPLVAIRTLTAVLSYFICSGLQPFFISGEVTTVFAPTSSIYRETSPVPSVMLIIMTAVVMAETAKIRGESAVE